VVPSPVSTLAEHRRGVGRGFGGGGGGGGCGAAAAAVASSGRVVRRPDKAPEFARGSAWEY